MVHLLIRVIGNSRHTNNTITFLKSLHSSPTFFPNTYTSSPHQILYNLIQKCTTMNQLKIIHAQIIFHDLTQHTLSVSKLISFCSLSASGDIQYAQQLFDQLPQPNLYMYNTLIRGYTNRDDPLKAISLYSQMICSGNYPNEFTFPFVLKACASVSGYLEGCLLHACILKSGYGSHVCVQNGLISVYFSFGLIQSAEKVFDDISDTTLVSWNSMISGYLKMGCCDDAFLLFWKMRELGIGPDNFTIVSLLSVCSHRRDVRFGRFVHLYIVVSGVEIDMHVQNALVDMYAKCRRLDMAQAFFDQMSYRNVVTWTSMLSAYAKHGLVECAKRVFDQMPFKNVVSWNSMISCYVEEGYFNKALDIYNEMCTTTGVAPDELTLSSVLSACCQLGNLVIGKKVHHYICSIYKTPSVTLFNALIDMYAKCGSLETSLRIFHEMPSKNVVSWNIIIGAHALHGCGDKAVELFESMEDSGFSPDEITFTGLLSACCHSGLIQKGRYYFNKMSLIYGVPSEIEHYACMVDLFGRVGLFGEAIKLIGEMPMKPDIVVWGALLGACRIHCKVEIGKQILKQVLELEPCNSGLYVLISNMFCEAGRWEDVKKIRKVMKECGFRKSSAISAIEINGRVHEFMVDDLKHEISSDVYLMLDQLSDHLKLLGYSCNFTNVFLDVEELF